MDVVDLEEMGKWGSVLRMRRACERGEGDHGQQTEGKVVRSGSGHGYRDGIRIIFEVTLCMPLRDYHSPEP